MTPRPLVGGFGVIVLLLGPLPVAGADQAPRQPTAADKTLLEASRAGELRAVRAALQAGASASATEDFISALSYAASGGHVGVVRALLEAGADPEAADSLGSTPLIQAAAGGHVDVVKSLVEAGAKLETEDVEGCTALMMAAWVGHDDVVGILKRAGASSDKAREAALCGAIHNDHNERALQQIGAGLEFRWPCGQFGYSFLLEAVDRSQVEIIRALVRAGADQHTANAFGTMPWDLAVLKGDERIGRILKDAGANPDAMDPWGNTALHRASFRSPDDPEPVRALVRAGAGVNARDESRWTPLMAAAARGFPRTVQALIELGADVNLKNADGKTALQIAEAVLAAGDEDVSESGQREVVRLLKAAATRPST